jgi:hypothetical protein
MFDPSTHDMAPAKGFLERIGVTLRPARNPSSLYDASGPYMQPNALSVPFALLRADRAGQGKVRIRLGEVGFSLLGLTPLMVDDAGLVVAGEASVGKGRIVVFARSAVLSEYFLGDVWGGKETSPGKLEAYQFAYDIALYALGREQKHSHAK